MKYYVLTNILVGTVCNNILVQNVNLVDAYKAILTYIKLSEVLFQNLQHSAAEY